MALPAASRQEFRQEFRQDLADIPILEDAGSVRMRSRDFFWFSPILKEALEDKRADMVAVPRDKADVMRIAAACAGIGCRSPYGAAAPAITARRSHSPAASCSIWASSTR
jgi:hypothetical protein